MKDVLVLPFPNSVLMPNRSMGKHWTVTRAARDRAKSDARYLAKQAGWQGRDVSGSLKITFYCPDKRKRDTDNLLAAMKPALDGVAQAIGVDDSNFKPLLIDRDVAENRAAARVELEFMDTPSDYYGRRPDGKAGCFIMEYAVHCYLHSLQEQDGHEKEIWQSRLAPLVERLGEAEWQRLRDMVDKARVELKGG